MCQHYRNACNVYCTGYFFSDDTLLLKSIDPLIQFNSSVSKCLRFFQFKNILFSNI